MVCALASSCAHLQQVDHKLPIRHALQVDQLVIYSDFAVAADHRLLVEIARQREEVCKKLDLPDSTEPVRVYLFESAERYRHFINLYYPQLPARRAFFMQTDTRLVVYAHWGDRVAEDLRHEVTHGYLHAVVPQIPLWLDEGIAENFETPPADRGLNRPHVDLLVKLLDSGWHPDLVRLERLTQLEELTQVEYAESWAWTHWLLETTPERRDVLAGYLRALRQAEGGPPVEPLSTRLRRSLGASGHDLSAFLRELAARR
jgi:hypothetical protein